MSATKFVCGRASWLALCAAMFTFGLSQVNAADEVAAEPQEDAARAVKQAAQAARLAWDGERRESPLLLLAAAELLGELVQAPPPEELEVHFPEAAEVAIQPLGFTPHVVSMANARSPNMVLQQSGISHPSQGLRQRQ